MTVSSDRWSCPNPGCSCNTVVVVGSEADTRAAIKAVQQRHADGHRRATEVLGRLGLPEAKTARTTRRKGKAA